MEQILGFFLKPDHPVWALAAVALSVSVAELISLAWHLHKMGESLRKSRNNLVSIFISKEDGSTERVDLETQDEQSISRFLDVIEGARHERQLQR